MSFHIEPYKQGRFNGEHVTIEELAYFDGTLSVVLTKVYESYSETPWRAVVSVDRFVESWKPDRPFGGRPEPTERPAAVAVISVPEDRVDAVLTAIGGPSDG